MDKTTELLKKTQALQAVEIALYKNQLGDKFLSEAESRKLLLKAGFKPPKKIILPPPTKEKSADGLELSHSIAKELIQDEVEGFMLKVKLVTQVGEYIFE